MKAIPCHAVQETSGHHSLGLFKLELERCKLEKTTIDVRDADGVISEMEALVCKDCNGVYLLGE